MSKSHLPRVVYYQVYNVYSYKQISQLPPAAEVADLDLLPKRTCEEKQDSVKMISVSKQHQSDQHGKGCAARGKKGCRASKNRDAGLVKTAAK